MAGLKQKGELYLGTQGFAYDFTPEYAARLDVYGFFNNHYAGHSPASVRTFAALLGGAPPEGPAVTGGTLFDED